MKFEVTILGCGAALPTSKRFPTAQVVQLNEQLFLVDCGEGTQIQLRKYKVRFLRINHIFISHLHGDHYLGLPGLISSMHLLGRRKELHVYGPKGIDEIIDTNLRHSFTQLNFELIYHFTNPKEQEELHTTDTFSISTIILKHRIPCTGFLFQEKERKPKINKSVIKQHQLLIPEIIALKRREDVVRENGEILAWEKLTLKVPEPKSYAYCSDTKMYERVIEQVQGVSCLYHESTFLNDQKERAAKTYHTTAEQAAQVASKAGVEQLVLGHFSSRYRDLERFLEEAHAHFSNTLLAEEGLKIVIDS